MEDRIAEVETGFWIWKKTKYRVLLPYPFGVEFDNMESALAYLDAYNIVFGKDDG